MDLDDIVAASSTAPGSRAQDSTEDEINWEEEEEVDLFKASGNIDAVADTGLSVEQVSPGSTLGLLHTTAVFGVVPHRGEGLMFVFAVFAAAAVGWLLGYSWRKTHRTFWRSTCIPCLSLYRCFQAKVRAPLISMVVIHGRHFVQ